MPGASEAQAAAKMHEGVVLPLVDQLRRRGDWVRLAFCEIDVVIDDTSALVTFEHGGQTVLPYGLIVPEAGERWRCLAIGQGGFYLDDLAVAAN